MHDFFERRREREEEVKWKARKENVMHICLDNLLVSNIIFVFQLIEKQVRDENIFVNHIQLVII